MRSRFTNALLAPTVVAFWFLNHFAFQYLHVDRDRYGIYWDRQEWIIRSYVLTFGFVTLRMFTGSLHVAGVGTIQEQMIAASWFSWAVPLLITECLIQGRKVLSYRPQSRVPEVERSASPTGRSLN